jgi:hypothetical protein
MWAELHFSIWKEIGVKLENKQCYDHVSNSVETSHAGKVTILWNQQVRTDRTIPNNKPHIIHVIQDDKGTRMLTFSSQAVILRTCRFNIQKYYTVHTLHLCCVRTSEQT